LAGDRRRRWFSGAAAAAAAADAATATAAAAAATADDDDDDDDAPRRGQQLAGVRPEFPLCVRPASSREPRPRPFFFVFCFVSGKKKSREIYYIYTDISRADRRRKTSNENPVENIVVSRITRYTRRRILLCYRGAFGSACCPPPGQVYTCGFPSFPSGNVYIYI